MKKTLTINIAGTVFHIEEDAYDVLKNYLTKINQHFASEEGGIEIINDIETRIAELFKQKLGEFTAISLAMVQSVIETMGLPHEMADNVEDKTSTEEKSTQNYSNNGRKYGKKLYREPSGAILGGVCGGLGHYLKIDRIWIRIAFFILAITSISVAPGLFVLLYIILWAALPKALTYSQRLEMQGEAVNVENIGKQAKEKPGYQSKNSTDDPYKNNHVPYNTYVKTRRPVVTLLKVLFGLLILLISLPMLVGLLISIFATTHIFGFLSSFTPHFYPDFLFENILGNNFGSNMLISVAIIVGIPILLLVYAGIHMIFNLQSNGRGIIFPALGVWVISIVFAIASSVGMVDNFKVKGFVSSKDQIENVVVGDTIILKINNNFFDKYDESDLQLNDYKILYDGTNEVIAGRPKFDIKKSKTNEVYLEIKRSSRSDRLKSANEDATQIIYNIEGEKNIDFDPYFVLDNNQKWRNQNVYSTLYLPEGYVVYLHSSLAPIIHDIKNVTNTWDGLMVSHYWEMKEEGLTQIDN